jgi:hypothetical protein
MPAARGSFSLAYSVGFPRNQKQVMQAVLGLGHRHQSGDVFSHKNRPTGTKNGVSPTSSRRAIELRKNHSPADLSSAHPNAAVIDRPKPSLVNDLQKIVPRL